MNVFQQLCKSAGLPVPETEYRFYSKRQWRADFAWPDKKLILEVEGGAWTGGRHTRGSGYIKDLEKYNTMAMLGYRLIRVVPKSLHSVATLDLIRLSIHN
jgi:very-short-patch-repair endonuclease